MRIRATTPEGLPSHRFPVDPWKLVETELDFDSLGVTETLFAVANGYLGMRANPSEGRDAHSHGTYVNGFHETWEIRHAESAHAFAKTGQTIVNVPDAKLMKLYVDDEPLLLHKADLEHYERTLDFRSGEYSVDLIWRTPGAQRIKVRSTRLVSLVHPHLAVLSYEIEMLDGDGAITLASQLMNRQDGIDEYHVPAAALGEGTLGDDPRQARQFDRRVLNPAFAEIRGDQGIGADGGEAALGYRAARSGMTLAAAYRHEVETDCEYWSTSTIGQDRAKTVFQFGAAERKPIKITKFVSYHTSTGVPAEELVTRCRWTIERAQAQGLEAIRHKQTTWLNEFWDTTDIEVDADDATQQAIRWHLFHLAQASAQTNEIGIPAKAVTAGGYDGHYFWDTEIYVIPFLAYTNPLAAKKLLRFRWKMLDAARQRASELSQKGALYPWRTINGEEASAYYAAGTAQYHINAAIAHAIAIYYRATGDGDFLHREGAEMLVETARLWRDLGFFAENGKRRFQIHGVTGPDEYTTVVNDNLYTNVMAQANLQLAAETVVDMSKNHPDLYQALVRSTGLEDHEAESWAEAAEFMYLGYDKGLGIHPQDASFLDREPWDFENTPADKYPLLLNFHPLVIYRHQVLKQADVVLAMYLQPDHFDDGQKRRNFDYYDALTTGDSSLSACVQASMAVQVGRSNEAFKYFHESLYLDLLDLHGNSSDGVHVANSGGVWATLLHGFAGVSDNGKAITVTPRLPKAWPKMTTRFVRHGVKAKLEIASDKIVIEVIGEGTIPVATADDGVKLVSSSAPLVMPG